MRAAKEAEEFRPIIVTLETRGEVWDFLDALQFAIDDDKLVDSRRSRFKKYRARLKEVLSE